MSEPLLLPFPLDVEIPAWCQQGTLAYCFSLSEATPSNNVVKNMHWMAYRKLRQMWRVRMFSQGLRGRLPERTLSRAALVIVRRCAGSLDWDNAYGGLKPVLDTLVQKTSKNPDGLGLVLDDSPRHMPYPPFLQQLPAPRGQGTTDILVFELP